MDTQKLAQKGNRKPIEQKPRSFKKGMPFFYTALRSFLIKAMGFRFKPLENLTTMQNQNYNPEKERTQKSIYTY